jgi:hypothetical protein
VKTKHVGLPGFTVCAVLVLAGCSKGVKGTYACSGGIVLKSITLDSDNKALVTGNVLGSIQQKVGTYSVNGDVVTITVDGSPAPFTYKDKTLDGGELGGRCIIQ